MKLTLRYLKPAEDSMTGWEHESLPLGNGYMGANVFGIVERERIQITENALENPGPLGGLNNFAELYIAFDHAEARDYERGLSLDDATAFCRYTCGGVDYKREIFASYPDRVLVVRLTASRPGALSFKLGPEIPFIKDYALKPGDGGGKSGTVTTQGNTIVLAGRMHGYNILFEGRLQVLPTGGTITADGAALRVENAESAVIIFALGTNYRLTPHVFLEHDPKQKLVPEDPGPRVAETLANAATLGYEALRERHLADYRALFARVSLDLAETDPDAPTDELLKRYGEGERIPYLEQLYFQYGRYLLISSSRSGCLPANLQGVWNCHDQSPWGSGYWHNINVQMNYWPAFVTNLAETFQAYADFYQAFRPRAEALATDYIRMHNPENLDERPGACGWTIGTASYAYETSAPGGHSGPGTGGLTSNELMALYPGTLINRETPAWMDAAKVTLNERGDESTGWAIAHRLNAWARTGEGNRAYKLLRELLGRRTLPNLWDTHPPFQIDGHPGGPPSADLPAFFTRDVFQIDGNLGGTAGIAEMLLQSHEGFVSVLPSLPEAWPAGRFSGLCARGGFVLAADWNDGAVSRIAVRATRGGRIRLTCRGIGAALVRSAARMDVEVTREGTDMIAFDTATGGEYAVTDLLQEPPVAEPYNLCVALPEILLTWDGAPGLLFNIYRAVDGASVYERLAERISTHEFQDQTLDFDTCEISTYKVTACHPDGGRESAGPVQTINHATPLDIERYRHRIRQLNA